MDVEIKTIEDVKTYLSKGKKTAEKMEKVAGFLRKDIKDKHLFEFNLSKVFEIIGDKKGENKTTQYNIRLLIMLLDKKGSRAFSTLRDMAPGQFSVDMTDSKKIEKIERIKQKILIGTITETNGNVPKYKIKYLESLVEEEFLSDEISELISEKLIKLSKNGEKVAKALRSKQPLNPNAEAKVKTFLTLANAKRREDEFKKNKYYYKGAMVGFSRVRTGYKKPGNAASEK